MAKRILLDNYVVNELNEYRKLWERYDELRGWTRQSSQSDSELISLAILSDIRILKEIVEHYEKEKAEVNDG